MAMAKMQIPGITIEVPESEVSQYKRVGYSVVADETPTPVEVETSEPTPVEKKAKK